MLDHLFIVLVIIGLLSSFVGTLAGGGGLITLPAMMVIGIPIHTGIATNKFSSGIAALTSVTYLLKKKEISQKTIILNVLIAFVGGIVGALITTQLSDNTMNYIALVLLTFALIVTYKNNQWVTNIQTSDSRNQSTSLKSKVSTLFIAIYDGGFGPGSSTFGIIHYMVKSHTYMKAVQLTRVLILGSATGAFIIFFITGYVQWHYAIALAIGSTLGSQLGLIVLPRVPIKLARKLLITIIFLLIGEVMFKLA